MHLLVKYGLTIKEIKNDGFTIEAEVKMYTDNEAGSSYYGDSLSRGISGFTEALLRMKSDIVVVTGDRLEPLGATLAAATLKIPVAHIHGGDKTDSGHIDESIRHSITRFAQIHFPATQESADRLIKMGEEPWRIHKVGAPGLDSVINQVPVPKQELSEELGLNPDEPIILCIFHSVHLESETAGVQMREITGAINNLKIQTVIIYPNNDAGSQDIIAELEKYRDSSFIKTLPTLSHLHYISLLKYASVLIGNSSSGIIEAPSLKLPVVNVGSRNMGREHAENVIFVSTVKSEIIKAIKMALYDESFRIKVQQCSNPYGDGKASERIVKVLSEIEVDKRLMQKKITY